MTTELRGWPQTKLCSKVFEDWQPRPIATASAANLFNVVPRNPLRASGFDWRDV